MLRETFIGGLKLLLGPKKDCVRFLQFPYDQADRGRNHREQGHVGIAQREDKDFVVEEEKRDSGAEHRRQQAGSKTSIGSRDNNGHCEKKHRRLTPEKWLHGKGEEAGGENPDKGNQV